MTKQNNDIETLSFENALTALEEIVKKLEEGRFTLEEALSSYEIGQKLKKRCENLLSQAALKVKNISTNEEMNLQNMSIDMNI
ncbi:MAG TPA: exodeoxyribonuclease VII small subunit [Alphaproteobacteria bacterium]|nr:exodeoxyribonuclease VII small subunit [Alphaproteobacteria bacterium]